LIFGVLNTGIIGIAAGFASAKLCFVMIALMKGSWDSEIVCAS
jgi:tetrahydromethanopterin S-methyltransferase subunit F